jgi:hypothetical protein
MFFDVWTFFLLKHCNEIAFFFNQRKKSHCFREGERSHTTHAHMPKKTKRIIIKKDSIYEQCQNEVKRKLDRLHNKRNKN